MKYILLGLITSVLMSCASQAPEQNEGVLEWDFDHRLQFKNTQIDDRRYHLDIIRMGETTFTQLSVFLLRKSYRLCGEYGYQIKMLSGIEGFLDKKSIPNYIQGNLVAEINCGKQNK